VDEELTRTQGGAEFPVSFGLKKEISSDR